MKEITAVNFLGGHFSISDIVLRGDLPAGLRQAAGLYADCVSGAIQQDTYLRLIDEAGFVQVIIQKTKPINLPDSLLANYLTEAEIATYWQGGVGIVSVTVYAPGTLPTK
ncbi:MAG TPA: arsenite S-adenosylmethyltransferase, partial [Fibrella sp.]